MMMIPMLFLLSFFCIKEMQSAEKMMCAQQKEREAAGYSRLGIADMASSGQRTVGCGTLELTKEMELTKEEWEILCRIVEAEAGNQDEDGKLLVANVVLNRVRDDAFPDSVTEVVFQKSNGVTQFSPVSDGSFYRVKVSEETTEAVQRALSGEDISEGALYFAAREFAASDKMKWFDTKLTFLFSHGGHEFFR